MTKTPKTTGSLETLFETLTLESNGARTTEEIFVGKPMQTPHGRAFGGQILAQAIMAASQTIDRERVMHSMHGYFLRPGDTNVPMTYSVDRLYDGRSFSTRRTQVYQGGKPMLSMIASFQSTDPGLEHQKNFDMSSVAQPKDIPSLWDRYGSLAGTHPRVDWILQRPFDIRHTESPIFLGVEGEQVAHQAEWVKTLGPVPDAPEFHRAALAFASDYSILEPIQRRHGISWTTPGLSAASLDHAMWFHRPFRVDEWLLFVTESPSAQGGRGLSTGRVYSRDGVLVASLSQEGMVRVPEAPAVEDQTLV